MASQVTSTGWMPLRPPHRGQRPARTPNEEAFLRLALNHTLAMAGDAMVTVALAGSIFFTTSPSQARVKLILALLLTMAPFAVVAPFLGPAIDRSKGGRRLMLVGTATGRALICVYMATVVHSVLLYPCALGILILSKAHAVAKSSLVPATVDSPADLVRAGSRLAILAAIAGLVAGGPAGAILKLADASWVLRVAAVVYAGAAVMAVRTRPAPPAALAPPDHVDELVRSRGVSLAVWARLTIRACAGFLTFAVAFVFRRGERVFDAVTGRTVRHEAPTWWYGVVVLLAVLGGFLGNVIGPRARRVLGEERMLTAALMMTTAVALVAARLDSRPGLALLALFVGMANGIGQLSFDAIVQRDGSEGARGRSFARYEATFQLAWVGAALIPVIIPIPNWVACAAIAAGAGTTAVFYFVGRRANVRLSHPRGEGRGAPAPGPGPGGVTWAAPAAPAPAGAAWSDDGAGVWSAVRDLDATPPLGSPAVATPTAVAPAGGEPGRVSPAGAAGGGHAPDDAGDGDAPGPAGGGHAPDDAGAGDAPGPGAGGAAGGPSPPHGLPRRNPGRSQRRGP